MQHRNNLLNRFSILAGLFLLVVVTAYSITARQMLSHASGSSFIMLWLIKNFAALSVILLPMMLGAFPTHLHHR